MTIAKRLQSLREKLKVQGIDGILVSQSENRYYLSGFSGGDGYLIVTPRDTLLMTDSRYTEQAEKQAPEYTIFKISGSFKEWFPRAVNEVHCTRMGFESDNIPFSYYQELEQIRGSQELVPCRNFVEGLRAVKEPEEIELIRRAAEISDAALEHFRKILCPGMTEKEGAWEIEKYMREHGSESVPFELIVASGPNSAMPHAQTSDRKIREGEPVIIDIGAKYRGYASDLTRTICAGKPEQKLIDIYNIVFAAQAAALSSVKTGMTGEQADTLARDVIASAGYGECFGHSLGHGVGLAVHELPRMGARSTDVLDSGMIITVEPGIYLPGWGGVRIEDTTVMRDGRLFSLSNASKTLA